MLVSFTADPAGDGVDLPSGVNDPLDVSVQLVTVATAKDDGEEKRVHTFFPSRNRFTTEEGKTGTEADLLFYYKPADVFKDGDRVITMDEFERLLTPFEDEDNRAEIVVVTYDRDGSSEFRITTPAIDPLP